MPPPSRLPAAAQVLPPGTVISLDNCDREPIHVPGAIQPHGALLALDRLGRLSHASANARALLGPLPAFGQPLRASDLGSQAAAHELIREALRTNAVDGELGLRSAPMELDGHCFDAVVHAHNQHVICEFERREQSAEERAAFAQKAYRSMGSLKRQPSIERLMEEAVAQIRDMTGFDRVMGYRFRHDDSGDVVAEARRDDLEPYLGRRYPASDIPAQARRLYVLNTLRLIADVTYEPVPLLAGDAASPPLDLSHSVLRSVSPIHVEYLRNLGVAASMSVSIVVGARLWGMIACHHMAPLQVPFAVRLACDVLAQLLASTVQSLDAKAREASVARAAWLRTELIGRVATGETVEDVLVAEAPLIADNLGCDALVVAGGERLHVHGLVDAAWAQALLGALARREGTLVHITRAEELPSSPDGAAPPATSRYCGVLALGYDRAGGGWLIGLRREQVQTIRWGGKPDKAIAHGPLGPRLTPRGSFAEWRETVHGTAVPWDETQLEIARQLLDALSRAHADRVMTLDRARTQLWAVLGHDLRNPLQSISMAAQVIGRAGSSERMNSVLRNSAHRMERLIADVLDISRLQSGLGLGMSFQCTDLVPLLEQLVEEVLVAYPETVIARKLPAQLRADVDAGRFAQVIANLLSNARQHGSGGIVIEARQEAGEAVIVVCNPSKPIPSDIAASLFDPFKRESLRNARNPSGMGLGLYIANQVARGHGGQLRYEARGNDVCFTLRLPLKQAAPA
ncbi:ATP-binding protein [Azohydromonas lata]|uniref:histidine kinase n=1 Tax=Azohydromonas lata TaxID=45677 RepID=A0ABU5IEY2_9BURK|nr:ATP-binding protein [Azohydromonas lata]MDZ5457523.1 GAF domain-containing protein [Azohydromonas lata]